MLVAGNFRISKSWNTPGLKGDDGKTFWEVSLQQLDKPWNMNTTIFCGMYNHATSEKYKMIYNKILSNSELLQVSLHGFKKNCSEMIAASLSNTIMITVNHSIFDKFLFVAFKIGSECKCNLRRLRTKCVYLYKVCHNYYAGFVWKCFPTN